ncbi:hypothetical protein NL676_013095 [Syzygium grande]|nr:hypothetical protein NL676_013095 [Syzygium grande]
MQRALTAPRLSLALESRRPLFASSVPPPPIVSWLHSPPPPRDSVPNRTMSLFEDDDDDDDWVDIGLAEIISTRWNLLEDNMGKINIDCN